MKMLKQVKICPKTNKIQAWFDNGVCDLTDMQGELVDGFVSKLYEHRNVCGVETKRDAIVIMHYESIHKPADVQFFQKMSGKWVEMQANEFFKHHESLRDECIDADTDRPKIIHDFPFKPKNRKSGYGKSEYAPISQ